MNESDRGGVGEVRLARRDAASIRATRRGAVDPEALVEARRIVEAVGERGSAAVRHYAVRFGEIAPDEDLVARGPELTAAIGSIDEATRGLIERAAERVGAFAAAQRRALGNIEIPVHGGGGVAGHRFVAVESAGCYVPGGRYPLPSSAIMTAVPAGVAGVERVWSASPGAGAATIAAAALSGAQAVLRVGGAHAIAALAFGLPDEGLDPVDVIVGPGNKWVTAAKHVVSAVCGIDMLAGPSEVLIIADDSAEAPIIAADMLAQLEHDADARAVLVTTSEGLVQGVERAIAQQLATLPTRDVVLRSLRNSFAVTVQSVEQAVAVSDAIGPEHLQVMTRGASAVAERCRRYGAVFVGPGTAEVLGDYGAGPNHTLPTGGSARHSSGLSVLTFMQLRTGLTLDRQSPAAAALYRDAAAFGRLEGLEAHARAAEARSAAVQPRGV
ncbi:MAG: histidinol dehydrogenase [Isosphaera sp.]|nr:histidinol dehydrogenase [Isosphaera sp.]